MRKRRRNKKKHKKRDRVIMASDHEDRVWFPSGKGEWVKGTNQEFDQLSPPSQAQSKNYNNYEYTFSTCNHFAEKPVFTRDGRQLYGTTVMDLGKIPSDTALIIKCVEGVSGFNARPELITGPEEYKSLNKWATGKTHNSIPILHLHWRDQDALDVLPGFWEDLWNRLPRGKIVVACVGSHGRTGTALTSLLLAACPEMGALEAVVTIRANHCEEAIESLVQMEAIDNIRKGKGPSAKLSNKILNSEDFLKTWKTADGDTRLKFIAALERTPTGTFAKG